MSTEDCTESNSTSPEDVFYGRIEVAWQDAGRPTPDEIRKLAWQEYEHELPAQTVKGWLSKERIPRLADQ